MRQAKTREIKMIRAKEGDTVAIHYIGTLDNGCIFGNTEADGEPLRFTIGAGEVFPALERAVLGMAPGEVKNVLVPAEEAYGPRRPENIAVLPRTELPPGSAPRLGQKVQLSLRSGSELLMRVTAVDDREITLDGNHALAGLDLTFALQLAAIE
jgi:FKBP-type peptidyl-prolyl cis-trans isomerase 2